MKTRTNDDLMKELLTSEDIDEINEEAKELGKKLHGGRREGSGRKKTVNGKVLDITKRLTKKEAEFIDYARIHNINYDDLMQG